MSRLRFCLLLFSLPFGLVVDPTFATSDLGTADFYSRTWMTDEGLPHNIVTHLIADRAGYMWLATSGGLARFDGREFKPFILPAEFQKNGYNIRGLAELPDASLLLLLPNGNLVQLRNGRFSLHPANAILTDRQPIDLFVGADGAIWVGTSDGVLLRWHDGKAATFGKAEGIDRRAPAFSFATDRHDRTWIASGRFLGYFENGTLVPFRHPTGSTLLIAPSRAGGVWVLSDMRLMEISSELDWISHSARSLPPSTLPRQIFEDRNHGVWVATRRQGLFRFTGEELARVPLSSSLALAIADDNEGNLWVGTEGGGVSILRRRFCTVLNAGDGLPDFIDAVCPDAQGGVWLAARKSGVHHLTDARCEPVAGTDGLIANSIAVDQGGDLWIGANIGLYRLAKNAHGTPEEIDTTVPGIRTLLCTRDGSVWFATVRGVLGRFTGAKTHLFSVDEGYANDRVTSIAEDPHGAVWLGSVTGNLRRFSDGQLTPIRLPPDIPVLPIHALHFDAAGRLWIGTAEGLLLYADGRFRRFTTADGLMDTLIVQINEDDSGHFWFGSSHGLFRASRDQLLEVAAGHLAKIETTKIGRDDGVPSLSLLVGAQPLSARDARGRLWFTAIQGAVVVDPVKFSALLPSLRIVHQETRVDGRVLESKAGLKCPSGRHRIEFEFAVLSYTAMGKIRVQHQLEGIDPDWIDAGASRTASYSSLPPGNYTLRFKARATDDAAPGNEGVVEFAIVPAWWQTRAAQIGAMGLALGVALGTFRRYSHWRLKMQLEKLQREHALEKERTRIARDLHDELGGSLTRIAFGVDQLKRNFSAPESHALLDQLSQRVRRHASDLQRVVWVVSPKNDTLSQVCSFITRFAQDYFRDSPVQCFVHSSTAIPAEPISPEVQHHLIAVAKEAFNNILKHARATQVTVTTEFQAPVFTLSIADNGVGFAAAHENDADHNGLPNMHARAAEIGARLEIRSAPGAGTTIALIWIRRADRA